MVCGRGYRRKAGSGKASRGAAAPPTGMRGTTMSFVNRGSAENIEPTEPETA